MSDSITNIDELKKLIRDFVDERDWQQFHSPKNLSMALAIEAAELMEHFQWIDQSQSRDIADDPEKLAEVGEEIADVFAYSLALADVLGLDIQRELNRVAANDDVRLLRLAKGDGDRHRFALRVPNDEAVAAGVVELRIHSAAGRFGAD